MISRNSQSEITKHFAKSRHFRAGFRAEVKSFLALAKAPIIRSYREFAEQEIIIPEGRFADQRFRTDTQPYSGPLLDAYNDGRWNRFAITGCVQSGKTLTALVIVVLYHLFETKETVILAAPNMLTCYEKWRRELLPVISKNAIFAKYLPSSGKGSRSGEADEIEFGNGAVLKFMSGGGGDEKRSHYTARIVVVTEVDKMDEASESSREPDPITQLEARTESFEADKRIFLECTTSVKTGRIWQERSDGTATELYCQCFHCKEPWSPGREDLRGWDDATNEIDARDGAYFVCPTCGGTIDDAQRDVMLSQVYVVHRGQTIKCVNGELVIEGDPPKTLTFGFRWNGFFNRLWRIGHIAIGEWRALQSYRADSEDFEDREKKQKQWVWTTPWEPTDYNEFVLEANTVRNRTGQWSRDVLPPDTEYLTCGVDIGKSTCWWFLAAFRTTGEIHVPAYGAFTSSSDLHAAIDIALMNSLREFRDDVIEPGFRIDGSDERMVPHQIWIDSGYETKTICTFVGECGRGKRRRENRYRPMAGRGRSQVRADKYSHPKGKDQLTREIGDQWYAQIDRDHRVLKGFFNADYWKLWVQKRLVTQAGQPGSLQFYSASRKNEKQSEHARISRHLTNERFVRREVPGRGLVEEWEKKGDNHWLDAAALACAAGDKAGFSLVRFTKQSVIGHSPDVNEMREAVANG